MAIDDLNTFKSTFAALPKVIDDSWKANLANWIDARVTSKMAYNGVNHASGNALTFTFNKTIFQNNLNISPSEDQSAGINAIATALQLALAATIPVTKVTSFIGTSTPATTWSIVASTIIDPASIALAQAKINELVTAPKVSDANDSQFPIKFREAFLLLTMTISGTNSVAPTPASLVDAARAVL